MPKPTPERRRQSRGRRPDEYPSGPAGAGQKAARGPSGGAPLDEASAFARLPALLEQAGIAFDDEAVRIMRAHFELLLRWNRRVNLTAVRDPQEIVERHFLESACLVKAVPLGRGLLYDVGSGAGFPGLPVKALCRDLKLVLVESNLKKAAFLKEAIRETRVSGASVESSRVESLTERPEVELADWITMRAVGGVEDLLRVFRHLLVPHGYVALFLGERDAARSAAGEAGYRWQEPFAIPGSERRVILVGQNLAGA